MVHNIKIQQLVWFFMESAAGLAMETSKVKSGVRNQAEAKLNQQSLFKKLRRVARWSWNEKDQQEANVNQQMIFAFFEGTSEQQQLFNTNNWYQRCAKFLATKMSYICQRFVSGSSDLNVLHLPFFHLERIH
ncbi:hypothetical protein F511_25721 [Dorcoceras hygrometricum]|uniref:Uncharacterized protein n=1 Tax=Dorcoceras hygrometricum TaxID=472368 RepID=A0A2Z7B8A7_9LAMI|nr:hypothetical protein F511_25721 [Dorcoceras hygrometricum]